MYIFVSYILGGIIFQVFQEGNKTEMSRPCFFFFSFISILWLRGSFNKMTNSRPVSLRNTNNKLFYKNVIPQFLSAENFVQHFYSTNFSEYFSPKVEPVFLIFGLQFVSFAATRNICYLDFFLRIDEFV